MKSKYRAIILCASLVAMLQGCAVVAVADAGVTIVATTVSVAYKGVGAIAKAIIPGDN